MITESPSGLLIRILEGLSPWIPGAVGAAFSLRFIQGSRGQKLTAFLLGFACAGYIGGWLIEYLAVKPDSLTARGISFAIGLFGFAIVLHATQQIPEVLKAALEAFKTVLERFTPGGK